jgi:hypothetical protein
MIRATLSMEPNQTPVQLAHSMEPPVLFDAIAGCCVIDYPQNAEIEINPRLVLAPGQGALALDVRVRLA